MTETSSGEPGAVASHPAPPSNPAYQSAPAQPVYQPAAPQPVYQPVYAAPAPSTDGLAIASFVCALCGLSIIPIILGHVALARIKRTGAGGTAFAVVGLVLGYLTLAAILVVIAIAAGATIWAVNQR